MPPSGYRRRDAQEIAAFLSSCIHALKAESVRSARGPAEALKREIAGIDSVLGKYVAEPFALHSLLLTRSFYERLLKHNPTSLTDLEKAVPQVLEEVILEITSVHVKNEPVPLI